MVAGTEVATVRGDLNPEAEEIAIDIAWEIGRLNYRRRNTQLYLKQETEKAKLTSRKVYWECTRRLGKSSELLAMFVEHCIQKPNWNAGFFAPVKEGLLDYIEPIIMETLQDCPEDKRPIFNSQRFMLVFPNGSAVKFRGANNKQHRVRRGNDFNEAGVDEGRDVDELSELVDSVIFPSLFNNEGYVYISSTPANSRSHPLYQYRQQAEANGWLIQITIWDANRMDPLVYPMQRIEEWKRETLMGVDGQEKWEREYECKWVVNKSRAAVPEWNANFIKETPRDPYYPFYHHYVAIDWGYRDFTAIGFGTYLFRQARLAIEGELAFSGQEVRSDLISRAISDHAEKLWGHDWTANRMVSDSADPILINELNKFPKMNFTPVRKEYSGTRSGAGAGLEAMLHEFRVAVNKGAVEVSPRCPLTLHCVGNAIWDERREKLDQDVFARHFDHLMMLVYMHRMVDFNTNPIPADFMIDGQRVVDINFDHNPRLSQAGSALEQAFGGKKRYGK
jgi:hypothetical protein